METRIKLETPQDIIDFRELCLKCSEDVEVFSGRWSVSGKSLLGLYTLDLSEPVKVEFVGDISDEVKEGMKKFIVN